MQTCAYHSVRNTSGCMLDSGSDVPGPGELSEAVIRRHKGLSVEDMRSEAARAQRTIRRGLLIHQFCQWMQGRPPEWWMCRSGYEDPEVVALCESMASHWPWNIEACRWTPGKIFMATRRRSWEEFEESGVQLREPYLRTLRLSADEVEQLHAVFRDAYSRAISQTPTRT